MDQTEIRAELARLADAAADSAKGAHWVEVRDKFHAAFPDALDGLGEKMAWDQLGQWAKDAIKPLRSKTAQLALPGFDQVPATVTVQDGEGGFVVKSLRWATDPDLEADQRIHDENVAAAIAAREAARKRNRVLLPVMREHGFTFAGEAIEHLTAEAA